MAGITPNVKTAIAIQTRRGRAVDVVDGAGLRPAESVAGGPGHSLRVSRFTETSPSDITLDPLHAGFAEEASGTSQQEDQREHVGEPVLDAAVDARADIDLGELLG